MASFSLDLLLDFAKTAALLAVALMAFARVREPLSALPRLTRNAADPVFYAALTQLSMAMPLVLANGVRVDFRVTIVALATVFAGPASGAAAALTALLLRLWLGGPFVLAAAIYVGAVAAMSLGYRLWLVGRAKGPSYRDMWWIGLGLDACLVPVWLVFLRADLVAGELGRVWATILVIVPASAVMLGSVITWAEERARLRRAEAELRAREAELRAIMDNAPVAIFLKDLRGRYLRVNRRLEEWVEWMRGAGGKAADQVLDERWSAIAKSSDEAVAAGRIVEFEAPTLADRAAFQQVKVIKFPVRDQAGAVVAIGGVITNETERKRTELALQETAAGLRAIMDNAPIAIFLKDQEGRYRLVNRCYEEWFGLTAGQVCGRTDFAISPPEIARGYHASDREVLDHGRVTQHERPATDARPGIEQLLATKFPIRDGDSRIVGIAGFLVDITARKRAETALRQNQDLLIESQRLGKVGYILTDLTSDRVYWSDSLFELRRVPRREYFSFEEALAFIHPEDRARYLAARNEAIAGRHDFATDVRILRGDGSHGWERSIGHPRLDAAGIVAAVLVVLRDITESKEAEDVLRDSQARLQSILDNAPFGVTLKDTDLRFVLVNKWTQALYETTASAMTGRRVTEFDPLEAARAIEEEDRRVLASGGVLEHEVQPQRRGRQSAIEWLLRTKYPLRDAKGTVVGIVTIMQDISERRRVEADLLQAQKMETVGRLAGGIAHDFNNLLGAVLGFAGFLLQDLPAGTPQRGYAERIVKASERGKGFVRQLLAFSRRQDVELKPHDIAKLVRETQDILRASLPSSTQLEVAAPTHGLVANVNAIQIDQILLNLCINANDALSGKPGRISVEVSRVVAGRGVDPLAESERSAAGEAQVVAGVLDPGRAYAKIAVSDTGMGMPDSVLQRIFEPFFTTKTPGLGTGLGLAIVHRGVLACGGACVVTSRLGHGSVFAIYLPLADAPAAQPPEEPHAAKLRGSERILIIDDDPDNADAMAMGLERLGYETVAVNDACEALAAFAEDPQAWDVVISDLVMPQMKGQTLAQRLAEIRPSVRLILCSGYSDTGDESALASGAAAFFFKPVAPEELAAAIRRALDRASLAPDA